MASAGGRALLWHTMRRMAAMRLKPKWELPMLRQLQPHNQLMQQTHRRFGSAPGPTMSGPKFVDVAVVGAGMVGAAVALGLASRPLTQGLRIALIDQQPPVSKLPGVKDDAAVPDPRVVAVSPASVRLLKELRVWDAIRRQRLGPFDTMQVWDNTGPGFVRYDAAEVQQEVLGYVVENSTLVAALQTRLKECSNVEFLAPASLASCTWSSEGSSAAVDETRATAQGRATDAKAGDGNSAPRTRGGNMQGRWAQMDFTDGRKLSARLVVGADGGRSRVRQLAGLRTFGWAYNQRAVISTVETALPHTTAWQRFLPTGPLALLPLGGTYSNVVWSTTESDAKALEAMDAAGFAMAVNEALKDSHVSPRAGSGKPRDLLTMLPSGLGGLLGQLATPDGGSAYASLRRRVGFQVPPDIVDAPGKRFSFPLHLSHAGRYVGPRLALVGDAAHTVHPLAGQGVNLGFGDAAALLAAVERGLQAGQDIGQESLLEGYEAERRRANLAMTAALDGLQRIFAAEWGPFGAARSLGLQAVQQAGPLKRRIMAFAMGL